MPQQEMQLPRKSCNPSRINRSDIHDGAAVESFCLKFELSKTRKRERDAEREQNIAGCKSTY
jgi:hypothetical protein